jgi:hypothetical protein
MSIDACGAGHGPRLRPPRISTEVRELARPRELAYRVFVASTPDQRHEWEREFEAAARRPLATRMRYAFIRTYKPVLDDASFRAFDTMADYRRWCEEHLPGWLGYGRQV